MDDIKEATATLAAKGMSSAEAVKNLDKTFPKAKVADKEYRARKDQSDMMAKDYSKMLSKALGKK